MAGVVIVAAACAAYANTFHVPFLFDDVASIVENSSIRQLWPPGQALSPPPDWGFTVSGRPILNLSLALNYAINGLEVWSYHALNLVIHVLAGLALFGLARRTLARPSLARHYGDQARPLALLIAGVWTLHPLQTESVTYIVQRAESLAGLFILLTLYSYVRAIDSPRPRLWWTASFSACLLGVGTKEIAALAPVLVLLYDRTFVSGSFRAAWQRHRWLLLALVATWLPLAWLVAGTGGNRGGTVGFDIGVSWSGYWLTQFEAITRYLGLAFWPHPLVFDYGKIVSDGGLAALPWAIPVVVLAVATLIALSRWPAPGFLGAWFFGILAPTSIVPGQLQMIVEHRMYLPLAAVIALVFGVAARWLNKRTVFAVGATLALAAGVVTVQRNGVYQSEERLWLDVLAKRPDNARAHNNLGRLYFLQDRFDEAIARHQESLRLDPSLAQTHFNLGLALENAGRGAEAVAPFQEAVRILPYYFQAHLNLGIVLKKLGRAQDALPHFAAAIRFDPWPADAHFHMGAALAQLGHWPEAISHYEQTVQLNPDHAEALSNWGVALSAMNSMPAAIERFNEALRVKPDAPDVHFNLGLAFTATGQPAEALSHYREAVRLEPDHADAQLNLGIALGQQGDLAQAIVHLEHAMRLRPDSAATHTNLAVALSQAGRGAEALAAYEAALRLQPADAQANYNVGYALLEARRWTEARQFFEEAVRLQPDFTAAREILRRLQESSTPP